MMSNVSSDWSSLILSEVKPTEKEIGRGAYGRVFEVDYEGTTCAAKEVHALLLQYSQDDGLQKIKADFLNECQIWSTIRHPCIVQFLGVYYPPSPMDKHKLPIIVMEKMQHSLRGLVEKYNNIPLNVKLSILDEVCLGLRYLHSRNPPIVHRDLTPNNILLSYRLEAKITDLGVAKTIKTDNQQTMTKLPGTPDFMPPEALNTRPVYGPSLDVFSYGGIILNVTTHQWPQPSNQTNFDPQTSKWEIVPEVKRRQHYLEMMTGGTENLKPLVISCLHDDPNKRPSVVEVSKTIKMEKSKCSQESNRYGVSPIAWWADVSSEQQSQAAALEEMTKNNEQLRKENNTLKIENDTIKEENVQLKTNNNNQQEENEQLAALVNKLAIDNDSQIQQINSQSNNIAKLNIENEKQKAATAALEEMTKNNEQLKKENDTLKTENHMMKEENHMMKEENVQLKTNGNKQQEENEQLATLLDQLAVNNESQIQLINSQSNTIAKLNIEVYQLKQQMVGKIKWIEGAPAPFGCGGHTAVWLNGWVYVGGGYDIGGKAPYNISCYDPINNLWGSPTDTPYRHFAMTTLNNSLVTAGGLDKNYTVINQVSKVEAGQLKAYTKMNKARSHATAAGHQGKLIITGGFDNNQNVLSSTELFDSENWQWYTSSNLPQPHYWLQAAIVDDTLYLLGGNNKDKKGSPLVFTALLGTLSKHQLNWNVHQSTAWCHSAPVTVNGTNLLIIGGGKEMRDEHAYTSDVYKLNRISNSWEAIGQTPSIKSSSAAVSTAYNRVIVIGGENDKKEYTNTVWIGDWLM